MEWLTWDYWGTNKSEIIRNLGLVLVGIIGLPLLIWRTYSSHKAASAALKQSEASLKQAEVAVQQIQVAIKQSEATLNQAQAAVKQSEIAADAQITDILTRAFDQLGSSERAVRIGAAYVLARIAHDSKRDHNSIMEAVTAYIRDQVPYFPSEDIVISAEMQAFYENPENQALLQEIMPDYRREQPKLYPEIQAMLSILGQRNADNEPFGKRLDLSRTNLRGANLCGLSFKNSSYMYSNLQRAHLLGAHLEEANFSLANLKGALFHEAHLNDADFRGANLEGAYFNGAILVGANFEMSNLKSVKFDSADLRKANLRDAFGLTQEQIASAFCDEETKLPAGITFKIDSEANSD